MTTVTEHALLPVVAGREDEFMETMERAKSIIAGSPGFVSLRVERCIERPNYFLLLVDWETLEDHTEGFPRLSRLRGMAGPAAPFLRPVPRRGALRGGDDRRYFWVTRSDHWQVGPAAMGMTKVPGVV